MEQTEFAGGQLKFGIAQKKQLSSLTASTLNLSFLLNNKLNGLSLEEINLGLISQIKEEAGSHSALVTKILDAVADTFAQEESYPIYTSGATNIFKYPELMGGETARGLISTLEDKRELRELVQGKLSETVPGEGIQVYIGEEMPMTSMRDCSVVTASYRVNGTPVGSFGVIGPTRMDYARVLSILKNVQTNLGTVLQSFLKEE